MASIPARTSDPNPDRVGEGRYFFTVEGDLAYLRDVPDAEVHLFNAGHFALEDHHAAIAALVSEFYTNRVRQGR